MTTKLIAPIVVGVDGTDDGLRAVHYGIREARHLGCGVRVVHVISEAVPLTPMPPLISAETLTEVGERIVNEAERVARDAAGGDVRIEKVVRPGNRVHVLVDVGGDAQLIVVGHHHRSSVGRIVTASTSSGVAGRANCPVVCVPCMWTPQTSDGRVVVGVDDPEGSREALGIAFGAAQRRNGKLSVLHAWKLHGAYDDIVSRVAIQEWEDSIRSAVGHALAEWRPLYPAVEVEIDVRHEHPADALVDASESAGLLVLGRRGHRGLSVGFHLGPVARTLIREAQCPVEIVPHTAATTRPDGLRSQAEHLRVDERAPQT